MDIKKNEESLSLLNLKFKHLHRTTRLTTKACSAERALAKFCVAGIGNFGERSRALSLLKTPTSIMYFLMPYYLKIPVWLHKGILQVSIYVLFWIADTLL